MAEVNLILVGVNHKTTPVEIREKLAFTKGKIEESVDRLLNFPEIIERLRRVRLAGANRCRRKHKSGDCRWRGGSGQQPLMNQHLH